MMFWIIFLTFQLTFSKNHIVNHIKNMNGFELFTVAKLAQILNNLFVGRNIRYVHELFRIVVNRAVNRNAECGIIPDIRAIKSFGKHLILIQNNRFSNRFKIFPLIYIYRFFAVYFIKIFGFFEKILIFAKKQF